MRISIPKRFGMVSFIQCLVVSLILAFLLFFTPFITSVHAEEEPLKVYYAGLEGSVTVALGLADFAFTDDLSSADVLVLNGQLLEPEVMAQVVKSGIGVFLIMGPEIEAVQIKDIFGEAVIISPKSDPVTLAARTESSDRLIKDVLWNTAPQIRERVSIASQDSFDGFKILVQTHESGELILGEVISSPGKLYILTAVPDGDNSQFRDWGYYNYLFYHLTMRAGSREPQDFSDYPGSPVPHPAQRTVIYILLVMVCLVSAGLFLLVRRYSLAHPELLDTLVKDTGAFAAREAGTDWEKIGFHRPLGGFMFALLTGLFLFIPLTVYQDLILPVYILPSAQALGIYGRVAGFFPIVWALFDMGTSVAHMKFFSEYRVRNPRLAVQYAQFFVWWQALTGALQVALVVAVVGTFLPKSIYALYTWAIITHTLIQIPGFYRLFTDAFSGIQRSDYGTILDMGINLVFPMFTQFIIVSLMVWWGKNNPVFGLAMGGVFGLGLAAYATELVSFIFGWFLYRRLGYNSGLLMLAHFSKDVAWSSLKFGFYLFLSGMVAGLASSINVLVVQNRLLNNNEILGNLSLAGSFAFAYTVFQALTGATMPSVSEAFSNGKKILAQYYMSSGYKYGGMVSAFICAALLSVADRFILGSSGRGFERAAVYVVPMLIAGMMNFAVWHGDIAMYGSGRTRLVTALSLVDLVLGTGLAIVLVDRFQVWGLLAVPFITTPVRILLGYTLNHRYCFPQRYYFWQSLAAPLLAAASHYLLLRNLTGLIWQPDEIHSVLILIIVLIPSFPIFAFLYGLFGGWDVDTLEVFDRGTRLTSFMRPIARLIFQATALGARISPLHNRFPFSNHSEAMAEAQALTEERVSLVGDQN